MRCLVKPSRRPSLPLITPCPLFSSPQPSPFLPSLSHSDHHSLSLLHPHPLYRPTYPRSLALLSAPTSVPSFLPLPPRSSPTSRAHKPPAAINHVEQERLPPQDSLLLLRLQLPRLRIVPFLARVQPSPALDPRLAANQPRASRPLSYSKVPSKRLVRPMGPLCSIHRSKGQARHAGRTASARCGLRQVGS